MKMALFALLLQSTSAFGSIYQEYCSNSHGTIRIARGPTDSIIEVTNAASPAKHVLTNADAHELTAEVLLDEKKCDYENGLIIWRRLLFRQFLIESIDGKSFEGIIGAVRLDYNTIRADMICETGGNAMDGGCLK